MDKDAVSAFGDHDPNMVAYSLLREEFDFHEVGSLVGTCDKQGNRILKFLGLERKGPDIVESTAIGSYGQITSKPTSELREALHRIGAEILDDVAR